MKGMELDIYQANLPATLEDLNKFILLCTEKIESVKAEIRAIKKLHMAEQVRAQKEEECRRLSEILLEAEIRLGELLKGLPKGNRWSGKRGVVENLIGPSQDKTKAEIIEELGLKKDQAYRFEMLAENKDTVEQLKAEARENDRILSRRQALHRVREERGRKRQTKQVKQASPKKQLSEEMRLRALFRAETYKLLSDALMAGNKLPLDAERLKALGECYRTPAALEHDLAKVKQIINKFTEMRDFLETVEIVTKKADDT